MIKSEEVEKTMVDDIGYSLYHKQITIDCNNHSFL